MDTPKRKRQPQTEITEEEIIVKETTETVTESSSTPPASTASANPPAQKSPKRGPVPTVVATAVAGQPQPQPNPPTSNSTDCARTTICEDPCTQAWKALQQQLIANPFAANQSLSQECAAAARFIGRFLNCHESEVSTLTAIQGTIAKMATVLEFGNEYQIFPGDEYSGYEAWLATTQAALQNICFLLGSSDSNKNCSPCGTNGTDARSSNFIQILELERIGGQLIKMVPPPPHQLYYSSDPDATYSLSKAVPSFMTALQTYRTAFIACDDQNLFNSLQGLRTAAAGLLRAFDDAQCRLKRAQCTIPTLMYDKLQADADCFAFLAANAVRAVNRLTHPVAGAKAELAAVWKDMASFLNGPVKRAFKKFEKQELCPATLCFDKATEELSQIIATGLAQAQAGTFGVAGIDDGTVVQQRMSFDQAVCAISRLDCKDLEGFDRCVLTGLGAIPIRGYLALNRNTVAIADQVRNLFTSFTELQAWFGRGKLAGDPPPAAMHLLEAGIRAVHSLVGWAQNQSTTTQATSGSPFNQANLGQLSLQVVGQNNQPLPNYSILIQPQAGGPVINRISGPTGLVALSVPAGSYDITDTTGAQLLTVDVTTSN